jgi:lipopolysaccharide export system protein LptA
MDGHILARRFVAGLLLMAAASMPVAHAERADRAKPVNIEADRLSLDDLKKESVFEGNVTLTQGSLMLRADRVVVRQDEQGFNYAFATGDPAYFRQKREGFDEYIEGYAQRLEYDGKQDKVEMFTNARVKKGIDEVRGDYISYNAVTEFYEVIGGGAAAASPTNPQGRVRAVIQPKRDMQKPARPDKPGSPQAAAEGTTLRPAATLRNPPQQ